MLLLVLVLVLLLFLMLLLLVALLPFLILGQGCPKRAVQVARGVRQAANLQRRNWRR